LLDSVAAAAGPLAAGVILTGMGRDGAAGLLRMRETGAFTIAQDAQSSAIFGMPAKAIECGAAAVVLPLAQIGPRLELWRPRTSVRGAQIPRDEASAAR
jgi:two-component system chemotaxis response regulator CheB